MEEINVNYELKIDKVTRNNVKLILRDKYVVKHVGNMKTKTLQRH